MSLPKIALLAFIAVASFASCKKDKNEETLAPVAEVSGSFKVDIVHVFGTAPLALNNTYITGQGEELQFNNFKYYISNIKLTKADGSTWIQPESYYLVDLGNSSSTSLQIPGVPEGDYNSIQFMLGVDSTRNVSGAQSGALAVSNNMFWTWSTGYIMAKFEGTSPQAPGSTFSFHVGGFQGNNASQVVVNYPFTEEVLKIRKDAISAIELKANAQAIFDNDVNIIIHDTPTIHQPGLMARRVMQNFVSGISFEHVHN